MRCGITASNGATALHLALGCLDLKAGDEGTMPAFACISCALAIIQSDDTRALGYGKPPVSIGCVTLYWIESSKMTAVQSAKGLPAPETQTSRFFLGMQGPA